MDAEVAKATQRILGKQGMKFKLNTKVIAGEIHTEGVKINVEAAKGGKEETVCPSLIRIVLTHHTDSYTARC